MKSLVGFVSEIKESIKNRRIEIINTRQVASVTDENKWVAEINDDATYVELNWNMARILFYSDEDMKQMIERDEYPKDCLNMKVGDIKEIESDEGPGYLIKFDKRHK